MLWWPVCWTSGHCCNLLSRCYLLIRDSTTCKIREISVNPGEIKKMMTIDTRSHRAAQINAVCPLNQKQTHMMQRASEEQPAVHLHVNGWLSAERCSWNHRSTFDSSGCIPHLGTSEGPIIGREYPPAGPKLIPSPRITEWFGLKGTFKGHLA